MNIQKVNLNLLSSLHMLLTESSVTKAASKSFITQAAMSNVLKQLRLLFDDELLVKIGKKMVLTQRAEILLPQIKCFFADVENILQNKRFNPSTSTRTFVIGMEEYAAIVLLPALYSVISSEAPNIKIDVKNIPVYGDQALLDEKQIELAVGLTHDARKASLYNVSLFKDKLICIARAKHPLLKKPLTLKNYLAAKHVTFLSSNKDIPNLVDYALEAHRKKRHIALRVSHIMSTVYTLNQSDLIATVPQSIAKEVSKFGKFSQQDFPLKLPEIELAQMWHAWNDGDSGCVWIRNVIKAITQTWEK